MSLLQSFGRLTIQTRTYVSVRSLHPKQFKSILENVPTKPRNAWQIFVREHIRNMKPDDEKTDASVVTKRLSSQWKELSEAEKQIYRQKYETEYKEHMEKFDEAINSATPEVFRTENALRKKYNLPLLKDPKHPKRPLNSFLFYLEHLRATNDPAVSGDPRSQVVEAASKYKQLPEHELKVFKDKAEAARNHYYVELEKYNATGN